MKFEEVLPKMRDEGMIASWDGCKHKFSDGFLLRKEKGRWGIVGYGGPALESDDWLIVKPKRGRDEI